MLVRLGGDVLFRRADVERMMALIVEHARAHGSITLAEARERYYGVQAALDAAAA